MIHGAFPAVLDAGVFREDQFPEFPGRPTVRGREVFEMKAHGFRRGKVIGQVESISTGGGRDGGHKCAPERPAGSP